MTAIIFNKKNWRSLTYFALFLCLGLVAFTRPCVGFADIPRIGVIYPDIRPPYRGVFENIIQGLGEIAQDSVILYDIEKDYDSNALNGNLQNAHVEVVIALGKRGLKAAKELPGHYQVIAGAVYLSPDVEGKFISGVSLSPDPEIMFARLKELVPGVTRVSVIYNPVGNNWLIDRARNAAPRYGLALIALPAHNLKTAAPLYRDIIHNADSSHSIWLLQDESTLDQRGILPMILKKAWENQFVVFSGNPGHVSKGALFSLYPDNVAMGHAIGGLALERFRTGEKKVEILPSSKLLIAVNLRTAKRLDLKFTSEQQREFDLVFPSR